MHLSLQFESRPAPSDVLPPYPNAPLAPGDAEKPEQLPVYEPSALSSSKECSTKGKFLPKLLENFPVNGEALISELTKFFQNFSTNVLLEDPLGRIISCPPLYHIRPPHNFQRPLLAGEVTAILQADLDQAREKANFWFDRIAPVLDEDRRMLWNNLQPAQRFVLQYLTFAFNPQVEFGFPEGHIDVIYSNRDSAIFMTAICLLILGQPGEAWEQFCELPGLRQAPYAAAFQKMLSKGDWLDPSQPLIWSGFMAWLKKASLALRSLLQRPSNANALLSTGELSNYDSRLRKLAIRQFPPKLTPQPTDNPEVLAWAVNRYFWKTQDGPTVVSWLSKDIPSEIQDQFFANDLIDAIGQLDQLHPGWRTIKSDRHRRVLLHLMLALGPEHLKQPQYQSFFTAVQQENYESAAVFLENDKDLKKFTKWSVEFGIMQPMSEMQPTLVRLMRAENLPAYALTEKLPV